MYKTQVLSQVMEWNNNLSSHSKYRTALLVWCTCGEWAGKQSRVRLDRRPVPTLVRNELSKESPRY